LDEKPHKLPEGLKFNPAKHAWETSELPEAA
jgi:hypothetical protein